MAEPIFCRDLILAGVACYRHGASRALHCVPDMQPLYAFWCRTPSQGNVGDSLTPWLIRRITGRYPTFARPSLPVPKYMVTGSIIRYAQENCLIWGPGLMSRDDTVSPQAKLFSVRGPLTREAALRSGASCPESYGDPALLLPRFYRPAHTRRSGLGLIPHFADKPRVAGQLAPSASLRILDVQQPVTSFVDQLISCEFVASSSLHGIIISHAYGIPAAWVQFSPLPSGDDSKFHDYFLSIGQPTRAPVQLTLARIDYDEIVANLQPPKVNLDLDRLLESCPFR